MTETNTTVQTQTITPIVSYLIGIPNDRLNEHYIGENQDKLNLLRTDQDARALRYLSKIRSSLMRNFTEIDKKIRYDLQNIDRLEEYFQTENIKQLQKWDIDIILYNASVSEYVTHVNKLIIDHVEACKHFFPEWVNWSYLKDLFILSDYKSEKVQKNEYYLYKKEYLRYPYGMYIHWTPDDKKDYILASDQRILKIIYAQHGESFSDSSKYHDATEDTKEGIYDFIQKSKRIRIVVDCENSDVYKLYGVLKNLNAEQLSKIDRIVLYDDCHTTCGWDCLEKFIQIPVDHKEVERVTDHKSLVDQKLTADVCLTYCQEHIDSFILCSSDSDYWALISSLPDAHFLVMYEYKKCGEAIKQALEEHQIFHCSMDDFYTGNADDLKRKVLLGELQRMLPDLIGKNAHEMAEEIYANTRITATQKEQDVFYDRYIKSLRLKINDDGIFEIVTVE